jgi:hypothetical protein
VYTIYATEPEDVAEGVQFANKHKLRLVIKNTGHDLLGRCVFSSNVVEEQLFLILKRSRSQGYGSLQIWVKYVQEGIEYHEEYESPSGCAYTNWTGSAFTVRGGYVWGDLYAEAFERELIVIGGQDPVS